MGKWFLLPQLSSIWHKEESCEDQIFLWVWCLINTYVPLLCVPTKLLKETIHGLFLVDTGRDGICCQTSGLSFITQNMKFFRGLFLTCLYEEGMKMERREKGKDKLLPILKIINQTAWAVKGIKLYPVLVLEQRQTVVVEAREIFIFLPLRARGWSYPEVLRVSKG